MRFKLNYFVIPSIAIIVSMLGRYFSAEGMFWFETVRVPEILPPDWLFSLIWTTIFALTTAAAVIIWNRYKHARRYRLIMTLFILNALANVLWSYIFFIQHNIGLAFVDALALELSVLLLIGFIFPLSRSVVLLLVPYAIWGAFACLLNYLIWTMN